MNFGDYPALYRDSDSLAKVSQSNHLRVVRTKVSLLILVGVIAAVNWDLTSTIRLFTGLVLALFLISSIVITAIAREKKFEETWFEARAVAEAVKAETWKYVMRIIPYDNNVDNDVNDGETDRLFLDKLLEILHSHQSIASLLRPSLHDVSQVTSNMKKFQNESFANQKEAYIQGRAVDQLNWYSAKASLNRKRASQWLVVTWGLEILAVVFALMTAFVSIAAVSPVAIVLAASAGVITWLNGKSYTEAAESYGLVAQELSIRVEHAKRAMSSADLGKTISDVENTINQEHRIWLGKIF